MPPLNIYAKLRSKTMTRENKNTKNIKSHYCVWTCLQQQHTHRHKHIFFSLLNLEWKFTLTHI